MNDFPLKNSEACQPGKFRPVLAEFKFKLKDLMKRKGKRCGCRSAAGMRTARSLSRMVHFSSLTLFFNIQPANQESNWLGQLVVGQFEIADLDGSVPFVPECAMPTRSSTKKKPNPKCEGARRVVEQGIGERLSGDPLDNPDEGKIRPRCIRRSA
jgi:hypothetical protein